jgi:HEPN domain-containing protein
MKNSKAFQDWLSKAEEDYGFAVESMPDTGYYAQVCFHFHQAAEKYLKAFIVAHGLEFRPVHNLIELLKICKAKAPDASAIEEACYYLNPFYIDTRYPVHWPTQYDREVAEKAMDCVTAIRDWSHGALERPFE